MEHMEHMGASMPAPLGKYAKPEHGTWEGHVLPGSFFIVWSVWWLFSNFRLYIKSSAKKPYRARSWYEFPTAGSKYPVEPILKMLLPFIGMNAELWAGHVSYRRMYDPATGHFEQGNLQDWQHAAMYAGFIASGAVDLLGFYCSTAVALPAGIEHAFLGVAFLNEGLLIAFHLKGTALDMKLHLLLVLVIFLGAALCVLEILKPSSFLLSTARSQLVLLQGVWFYQIAQILFKDDPAWDPSTHGAVMMVPFFFVVWVLVVSTGTLLVFVCSSLYLARRRTYRPLDRDEESGALANGHGPGQEIGSSGSATHRS